MSLENILKQIPQQPQAQYSLEEQLNLLRFAANKFGLYDAADFIRDVNVKPNNVKEHVAVICLDTEDFLQWKKEGKSFPKEYSSYNKFTDGDCMYHRVSRIDHLCSIPVNRIVETKYAKQNKEYLNIMEVVKSNLKTQ